MGKPADATAPVLIITSLMNCRSAAYKQQIVPFRLSSLQAEEPNQVEVEVNSVPSIAQTCRQKDKDQAAACLPCKNAAHGRPAAFYVLFLTTLMLMLCKIAEGLAQVHMAEASFSTGAAQFTSPAGQCSLRSFKIRSCKEMPGRRPSMQLQTGTDLCCACGQAANIDPARRA